MFGCASDATARASRSKRALSASGASSLIATRRPSSRSSASQTSDIPPRPSTSSSRYRPPITVSGMPIRYALIVGDLVTLEQAQALVLSRTRVLAAELVPVWEAAGRVTVEPARALVDLPPFPSSAMDGFAVHAADLPGSLPVVERVAAGRPATRPLADGEAMEISTGGVVPDGADSVLPLEYVVQSDNEIEAREAIRPGAHVRPRGSDVARGDVVVGGGVRLGAAQLGALAAAGIAAVTCARRPRVAILATGSELARPGDELAPGQIYESNGLMLAAALAAAG